MGTYRTLTTSDVAEILAGFGVPEFRSFAPITAGTINTNAAIELADGRRFLRINEGKAREDVAREAAIVGYLCERGVPTPRPLLAPGGEPWLDWRGVQASLFPWVDGRTLGRSELGPEHAAAAGVGLARVHQAGLDYGDRRLGRYEPAEIQRRFDQLAGPAQDDPALAAAIAELGPELARLERDRRPDVPRGLIHGDLFIDNVLFRGTSLAALLDFEQASWGRLVYDIAVSVLAFGFGADDFREDVTRAFIEGYLDTRPVPDEERAAFGDELCFAACRFTVTRITDVYLRREAGAPPGKDFRRYLQRLRAVKSRLLRADDLLELS
jgi:homoserine kinase type II